MNKLKFLFIIFIGMSISFFLHSCKKDNDTEEKTVTDIEGNVYPVVKIGTQTWTAENLKSTKLNDGSPITNVTDNNSWNTHTSPGYCWYGNDVNNKTDFGALYNWYAVNTGKLCPAGWHVPNDVEWSTLTQHLGGEDIAGGKLKETGTTYWNSPNTGATNESGFSARGSGVRLVAGEFNDFKNLSLWWTSTLGDLGAMFRYANNQNTKLTTHGYNKKNGLSVRCIKDAE